jgi:hypothetical protein
MSNLELIENTPAPSNVAALPLANTTPADLMRVALQSGAGMDVLERFMALQVQWEEREAVKAFNVAFAAFKAEAVRVIKNREVTAGPLAGKKYAELFAVVNAVTPALSLHGLSASWKLTIDQKDWIEVTCTIKHSAGHSESVSMGGPPDVGGAKNPIQARASTVSYLERYTLKAITGLSEQEDDNDGGFGGSDAATRATQAQASNYDDAIAAGRSAAMEGMASLTAWWGRLTGKQRADLGKEFAGMRKAAQQADQGAGR